MRITIRILIALLGLSLVALDADARRLGGGSSLGRQRPTFTQPAPKAPTQSPSVAPANPAQQPQPSGMSRWLGPLAGLALGAGLASLFMNGGFGGLLIILLAAAAAVAMLRMLRPKPQSERMQYAGAGAQGNEPGISNIFGAGAAAPAATVASPYPAEFDAEQFVRHAKMNFTRLQAAHDQGDLSAMRDFMTPELYTEVATQIAARNGAQQKTDVVTLNAQVLEVVTERNCYVASVNFTGIVRENADGPAEPFDEIWHLEKPVSGDTGWLIAGIQQR